MAPKNAVSERPGLSGARPRRWPRSTDLLMQRQRLRKRGIEWHERGGRIATDRVWRCLGARPTPLRTIVAFWLKAAGQATLSGFARGRRSRIARCRSRCWAALRKCSLLLKRCASGDFGKSSWRPTISAGLTVAHGPAAGRVTPAGWSRTVRAPRRSLSPIWWRRLQSNRRAGETGRTQLAGLLRQAICRRLAGDNDVADASRRCGDPLMGAFVGAARSSAVRARRASSAGSRP